MIFLLLLKMPQSWLSNRRKLLLIVIVTTCKKKFNPYTTDLSNLKLYWTSEGYEKEIQISKISRLQLKEIPKDGRELKNILLVRVIDLPCCNIFRPEALFVKRLYRDKLLRGGVHISLNDAHCVADDGNFPIVSLDDKHVKFFSLKFICKKIEIVE